eukprot:PhM_4_TR18256/c0_g2_i1/m.917/K08968/msrC; L-methionine (R)-S-oxide reductase
MSKSEVYQQLLEETKSHIANAEGDVYVALSNICAAIHTALNPADAKLGALPVNWVGFYLMKTTTHLVLGPFQGKPACVRIQLGKGVCGMAALQKRSMLVADVHKFPGHIACDCASKSEVVVPLREASSSRLVGVIDIDSTEVNHFDDDDLNGLRAIAELLGSADFAWPQPPVPPSTAALTPNNSKPSNPPVVAPPSGAVAPHPTGTKSSSHEGWSFTSKVVNCIMCSSDLEDMEHSVGIRLVPEIIFDQSAVTFDLPGKLRIHFSARDALTAAAAYYHTDAYAAVRDSLKVQHYSKWKGKKLATEGITGDASYDAGIDWAFRNIYAGTVTKGTDAVDVLSTPTEGSEINYALLKRTDVPILFYDKLDLFEDELHDCGTSRLSVRFRVMPTCYFLLLRHFIRVDNVCIVVRDTRWFHEFGKGEVLCEVSVRELKWPVSDHLNLSDADALQDHLKVVHTATHHISVE